MKTYNKFRSKNNQFLKQKKYKQENVRLSPLDFVKLFRAHFKTYLTSLGLIVVWPHFRNLLTRIARLLTKSGPQFTVLFLKEVELQLLHWVDRCERKSHVVSCLRHGALKGYPSLLFSIRNYVSLSHSHPFDPNLHNALQRVVKTEGHLVNERVNAGMLKLILTCLHVYREFRNLRPKHMFGSIVTPPSYTKGLFERLVPQLQEPLKGFKNYITNLGFHDFDVSIDVVDHRNIHLNNKAGPKGKSIFFIEEDYNQLRRILELPDISFSDICTLGYCNRSPHPQKMREVVFIPDKGYKSRPITKADYFSQSLLKDLNTKVYKILALLPHDWTYRQSSFESYGIRLRPKSGNSFWSIDMKGATDRFPREFQCLLVEALFGKSVITTWRRLITVPFLTKKKRKLYFQTGQPLGLLSSWAVFSLSHHFLIYWLGNYKTRSFAYYRILDSLEYEILGDDILIYKDSLAKEYCKALSMFGVKYKLYITSPNIFEFRKLWFLKGYNVTPFKLNSLVTSLHCGPHTFIHEFVSNSEFAFINIVDYLLCLKTNYKRYSNLSPRFTRYLRSVADVHSSLIKWKNEESKDLWSLTSVYLERSRSSRSCVITKQRRLTSRTLLYAIRYYFTSSRLDSLESDIDKYLEYFRILISKGIHATYFKVVASSFLNILFESPFLSFICNDYVFRDLTHNSQLLYEGSQSSFKDYLGFYDRDVDIMTGRDPDLVDIYVDLETDISVLPDDVYEFVTGLGIPTVEENIHMSSLSRRFRRFLQSYERYGFDKTLIPVEYQCARIQIKVVLLIWVLDRCEVNVIGSHNRIGTKLVTQIMRFAVLTEKWSKIIRI